jgi:hypothetical protein
MGLEPYNKRTIRLGPVVRARREGNFRKINMSDKLGLRQNLAKWPTILQEKQ